MPLVAICYYLKSEKDIVQNFHSPSTGNNFHHHFPLEMTLIFLITGCDLPDYYGDGYCDDENNKKACFFDGGDCCGPNVNTQYCTACQCLSDGGSSGGNGTLATTTPSLTTNSGGCSDPQYVGDNYCDDGNNNQECNYDGGDCCGFCIITDYCTYCECHLGNYSNHDNDGGYIQIGNGYCQDDLNKLECNFDGGDCCAPDVDTNYCTVCQCLSEGGSTEGNVTLATTTLSLTTSSGGCSNPGRVSDNYCDDGNNNQECNYDGGDCCGSNVNTEYCTVCQCLE